MGGLKGAPLPDKRFYEVKCFLSASRRLRVQEVTYIYGKLNVFKLNVPASETKETSDSSAVNHLLV